MKDLTGKEAIQAIELLTVRVSCEKLADLLKQDVHKVIEIVKTLAVRSLAAMPAEEVRAMLTEHNTLRAEFIEEFDRTK